MTILLLLASLSWGQTASTAPATPLGLEDDLKLQNVRKDVREILVGRPTVTGLPTFKNGIKFGDGTTQTTAATTAANYVSTFGFITGGSAGTGLDICVTGSTRTATVARSFVDVIFSGSGRGSASSIGAGILVNGAYPAGGFDADTGIVDAYVSAASENQNLSFTYTRLPVTPGSVSICLTGTGGVTMTFCTDMGTNSICRFGFRESD